MPGEGGARAALRPSVAAPVVAGTATMVALCFANGLQGGASQAFAQATESLKSSFHVGDAALGLVPFGVSVTGTLGAVPIAALCARHKRVAVLAGMFLVWGVLLAVAGLVPAFTVAGSGVVAFAVFALVRITAGTLEATDPAALPLIADWWPAHARAQKVSLFNTLAALGSFVGLGVAGVLVDRFGWRPAFVMWLPLALLGALLMRRQREPEPGAQDAAFAAELEDATVGAEHEHVVEVIEGELHPAPVTAAGTREAIAALGRCRTWRLGAVGIAVSGLMTTAMLGWGLAYFKRTFGLDGTEAAELAPVLGMGAFAGMLGGGHLADRLLARDVVRARLHVTAFGFAAAAVTYALAFSTTSLGPGAALLGVASLFAALPMGPQMAMLMDVTPAPLRSQAAAALNVLQVSGALGPLLVGGLSTLFGEDLRLALLCVSPTYLVGAVFVFAARTSLVDDMAVALASAR